MIMAFATVILAENLSLSFIEGDRKKIFFPETERIKQDVSGPYRNKLLFERSIDEVKPLCMNFCNSKCLQSVSHVIHLFFEILI